VHTRPRASDVVTHQRDDDDGADQLPGAEAHENYS
jgi:hypothetical protein